MERYRQCHRHLFRNSGFGRYLEIPCGNQQWVYPLFGSNQNRCKSDCRWRNHFRLLHHLLRKYKRPAVAQRPNRNDPKMAEFGSSIHQLDRHRQYGFHLCFGCTQPDDPLQGGSSEWQLWPSQFGRSYCNGEYRSGSDDYRFSQCFDGSQCTGIFNRGRDDSLSVECQFRWHDYFRWNYHRCNGNSDLEYHGQSVCQCELHQCKWLFSQYGNGEECDG